MHLKNKILSKVIELVMIRNLEHVIGKESENVILNISHNNEKGKVQELFTSSVKIGHTESIFGCLKL